MVFSMDATSQEGADDNLDISIANSRENGDMSNKKEVRT